MIPPSTNKRFSLDSIFHFDDASRPFRLWLSLAAILLYWILFWLLHPLLGGSVTMLMFLPVIAIAWFYGVIGGIFGPFILVAASTAVLVLESTEGDPSYLLHSLAGWLGFTMVGLLVGRVSTLRKQIRTELEDRRQAQQALQESEERYRVLFENSQTGMLLAEALRETAALLNSSLDLDAVLDAILHNVGKVLPHDAVNIMRVEDGVERRVYTPKAIPKAKNIKPS